MVRIPPPVWAFIYEIIAGLISWYYPWRAIVDLRIVWLGAALVAAGLVTSAWAFSIFQSEGTEILPHSETNTKLVTHGPFRLTRNPMYLGLIVLTLGIAFWVGALPMFLVPLLVFATTNRVHIPFEEAKMRRQFGTAFDDYTAKVRRWV